MRILYVEDNDANISLVKRIADGHNLINYPDAETALENFNADAPDLLLVDLRLAGQMDGLEMILRVRAAGYDVPIVVVTAYATLSERQDFIDAGCDEFIVKPIPVGQLVDIIQQAS